MVSYIIMLRLTASQKKALFYQLRRLIIPLWYAYNTCYFKWHNTCYQSQIYRISVLSCWLYTHASFVYIYKYRYTSTICVETGQSIHTQWCVYVSLWLWRIWCCRPRMWQRLMRHYRDGHTRVGSISAMKLHNEKLNSVNLHVWNTLASP